MLRLSQELVDEVIGHLYDSPESLRACSLTARSWLPASRRHIHVKLIYNIDHDPHSTTARRIQFYAQSPALQACVRVLLVTSNMCGSRKFVALPFGFPRLRTIELVGDLRWDEGHGHSIRDYMLKCVPIKHIRTLVFRNTTFESFAAFRQVLLAFPTLSRLTLVGIRISNEKNVKYVHESTMDADRLPEDVEAMDVDDSELSRSSYPEITLSLSFLCVDLKLMVFPELITWLLSPQTHIRVDTLVMEISPPLAAAMIPVDVQPILDKFGPSIRHLRLEGECRSSSQFLSAYLRFVSLQFRANILILIRPLLDITMRHLCACTQVQTVHVDIGSIPDHRTPWAETLFDLLRYAPLSEVSLSLPWRGHSACANSPLPGLDGVLSAQRTLRRCTVFLSLDPRFGTNFLAARGGTNLLAVRDAIQAAMPQLTAKGILHAVYL